MADFSTLKDLDVKGKRVLMRVDFNCPIQDGRVSDDTRIQAAMPSLRRLLDNGAAVVLMSHLGRPKGKRNMEFSLGPVAARLQEVLGKPVKLADDCIGEGAEALSSGLKAGEVLLLENLRFHPEEEANDAGFAEKLARHGQIYVNDAFGTAHRAHASTVGVAKFLPSAAGLLMEAELTHLGELLGNPQKPFVAILGGSKVSDKIAVLESLVTKADVILIGGGMAFTFIKSHGGEIGKSLCEADMDLPRRIEEKAKAAGVKLLLPVDVQVSTAIKGGSPAETVAADQVPADKMGLDIGDKTAALYAEEIARAKTIFWNGPMGVFEVPPFDKGTRAVAESVCKSGGRSCIGGGDSAAAVTQMGMADRITHVSTGGGASMEFLEGQELPGVAVLRRSAQPA
ncbi:MAG: phosphoglycerate kinase [Vulcanimicrobiota bacterium]